MNLVAFEHHKLNPKSQTELSSAFCSSLLSVLSIRCDLLCPYKIKFYHGIAWRRREKTQCSYWGNWETICRSQCRAWGSGFKINAIWGIKGEVSVFSMLIELQVFMLLWSSMHHLLFTAINQLFGRDHLFGSATTLSLSSINQSFWCIVVL